jgi:lipopolysaccharide export system protein LptA
MSPRAAASAALLIAATCAAGAALARSSDRNQPMDITSSSLDCSTDPSRPCVYAGGVHVVQGTLDIRAARAEIRQADGDIQRVLLSGAPVRMRQALDSGGTMSATARNVDYDMPRDTVVFTGGVEIDQPGRGTMSGERIVYNMATGQVQGSSGNGGQIRTRILPRGAQGQAQPAARDGG